MAHIVYAWPELSVKHPASRKKVIPRKGAGAMGRGTKKRVYSDFHVRQMRDMYACNFTVSEIAGFWGLDYGSAYKIITGECRPYAGGDFPKKLLKPLDTVEQV